MRFTVSVLATALVVLSSAMQAQAKAVFAHFIVGNAGSFVLSDWESDIALAMEAGIDGFALNFAGDSYTSTQLDYAYTAAAAVGFKLFLSFDYAANSGNPSFPQFTASNVINWINTYKGKAAQFLYNGQPLVSTFEGTASAGDWPGIISATGCFFVPDWTSAKGTPSTFDVVDGALSWDIWPDGPTGISTIVDEEWQGILGPNKAYMMGVSPWFYTNLPGKNWLWRGDNLWHDRWQQVLEVQPELVEILTWNDFGESHYIGPLHNNSFPAGSQAYVSDMAHDGWRAMLPYYIAAYKNGNTTALPVETEQIVYSHRINPADSGSTEGTTGNAPFQKVYSPGQVSLDAIGVDAIVAEPSTVTVQIGDNAPTTLQATTAGPNHFLVYFNGQTGPVKYSITRNGETIASVTGATITTDCANGVVNWNAIVGTS